MDDAISDLKAAAARIDRARTPEDLFGVLRGTKEERLKALAVAYRRLVLVVHPDVHDAAFAPLAQRAFVRATALRDDAERAICGVKRTDRRIVTARKRTYVVGDLLREGDLADLFACTYVERAEEQRAVFKACRAEEDGDLLENEARVLRELYPSGQREEKFFRYLPRLVDSFVMDDDTGARRRVNVFPHFEEHVSLEDVMNAHPHGLDWRDGMWILKRLLAAFGWIHRQGVVHGAILPPHVLVHPVNHGARIVDWSYATHEGTRVTALSSPWRAFYAPEIPNKEAVGPQTDIFMIAKTVKAILRPDIPEPIARFLATCLAPPRARRPDDAWALHEDLDELLRRLVGKRCYRPLAMPGRT